MNWRVQKMCAHCPFRPDMDYLAPGRLDGIKEAAILGRPFYCHETIRRRRADRQECAGQIAYRERVWREDPASVGRILEKIIAEARG